MTPHGRSRRRAAALVTAGCVAAGVPACAPRARALAGAPAPAAVRLPRIELGPGPQRVVFRWRYEEDGFSARGEGVARIAVPDSARLDFFLDGGFGSGWAVLIGDSVSSPAGDVARRLIPPAPLLWAAFGRLAIAGARDTTIRTSADTLRADLSSPGQVWRVTTVGPRLTAAERIVSGRVVERLTRDAAQVRYANIVARRSLAIDIQRTEAATAFPRAIWTR